MSFLKFFFGNAESRATKMSDVGWGSEFFSYTGRHICENDALKVATIYGCVRVLSETLAGMPLIMYRRLGDDRERAVSHPLYNVMKTKPNNFQTSFQFREMLMGHVALRGWSFSQIVKNAGGQITQLVPLNPDKVTPKWGGGNDIVFDYQSENGLKRTLRSDQVLYLPGLSSDPLSPLSPLDLMSTTIDAALSTSENAAQFFKKSTRPSGILQYPGKIKEQDMRRLKREFDDANSGVNNAFQTIILEQGLEWKQMGLSNEQSQFIETRKFEVNEICRYFRVPPHLVGDLERATFSNIEQQSLEFITYTMGPWITRFEQSLNRWLLTDAEQDHYYFEFLVDGLLRSDIKTRYESYAIGVTNGWLSRNEVRRMENRNSEKGLDDFLIPLNMEKQSESGTDSTGADDDSKRCLFQEMRPAIESLISEALRKEFRAVERASKRGTIEDDEYLTTKHYDYLLNRFRPIFECLFHSEQVESRLNVYVENWSMSLSRRSEDFRNLSAAKEVLLEVNNLNRILKEGNCGAE